MMETETALSKMFMNVWPHLGERERRLVAAGEAKRIGRRGISMVSRACGLSRVTITKGIKELDEAPLEPGRTRRAGAGRPRVERADPGIWDSLDALMRETTKDEPSPPLLWTCKSTRCLSQELTAALHRISHEKVAQILRKNGYNLMGTRKTDEGAIHPDRDSQFRYISRRASHFLSEQQPIVAVETRRKEGGQEGAPNLARGHAYPGIFPDPLSAGAHPHGVYDSTLARKSHTIPTSYDTVSFTCDSVYGWWIIEGKALFPDATTLFLTADNSGGLRRHALWKTELQRLANRIGLPVEFCRYPPGTSKWNNTATRLFSFVTTAYADEPQREQVVTALLVSRKEDVRTMALGLKLDHSQHEQGPAPTEDDLLKVAIHPVEFHGEWNYIIAPDYGSGSADCGYRAMTSA
jgi:hypothetical protein